MVLILHPTPTQDENVHAGRVNPCLFVVASGHLSQYLAFHYIEYLWIPMGQNPHLGIAKHLLESMPFICKSPTEVPYPGYFSYTRRQYPLALIMPWPGTRQLATASTPQSQLKLCKLASPQSAYSMSLLLSHKKHNKGSCQSILYPLPPDWLWYFPDQVCPSFYWNME